MLKIVKWLAILFAVFLGLIVLVGFLLPKNYHVERSIVIQAEPAVIHTLVGDLKQWDRWSPWREADPTYVTTLGEKTTGVGAHQSWTGDTGGGRLTFTADTPETGVVYDLTFENDLYPSVGRIIYETLPEGGTRVTWLLDGENPGNPVGRYFGLLVDGMVGPMFDTGLNNLRREAEALARKPAAPEEDATGKEPV